MSELQITIETFQDNGEMAKSLYPLHAILCGIKYYA